MPSKSPAPSRASRVHTTLQEHSSVLPSIRSTLRARPSSRGPIADAMSPRCTRVPVAPRSSTHEAPTPDSAASLRKGPAVVSRTAANTPFTGTQLLVFFLTYTTYALVYFARKPLSILKPQIQSDEHIRGGVSAHTLAMLDSSFLLAYTAGQFLIPSVTSTISTHTTYIALFVTTAASLLAFSSAQDSSTLVLMWTLNGLAQSCLCSFSIAILTPYFSSSVRGRLSGLWTTCQNVGSIVSSWLAAVLVGHGWRWVLTYISLGMLCWSAVLVTLVPLVKRRQQVLRRASTTHANSSKLDSVNSAANQTAHADPPAVTLGDALRCPGVFRLGVLYFCVKAVRYNLLFWLPYILTTHLGLTTSRAGTTSILFDAGGILGVACVGFLSDLLPHHRVTITVTMCAVSGLLVLIFAYVFLPEPRGLGHSGLALLTLVGVCIGAVDSIASGPAVQDTVDRAAAPRVALAPHFSRQAKLHALSLSCVNGLGSLGSVLQGIITTYVVDAFGWSALLSLLGALCLAGSMASAPAAITELASHSAPTEQRK